MGLSAPEATVAFAPYATSATGTAPPLHHRQRTRGRKQGKEMRRSAGELRREAKDRSAQPAGNEGCPPASHVSSRHKAENGQQDRIPLLFTRPESGKRPRGFLLGEVSKIFILSCLPTSSASAARWGRTKPARYDCWTSITRLSTRLSLHIMARSASRWGMRPWATSPPWSLPCKGPSTCTGNSRAPPPQRSKADNSPSASASIEAPWGLLP
jgi:hypothetical protein